MYRDNINNYRRQVHRHKSSRMSAITYLSNTENIYIRSLIGNHGDTLMIHTHTHVIRVGMGCSHYKRWSSSN